MVFEHRAAQNGAGCGWSEKSVACDEKTHPPAF
jgi:hypothetical protein